MSVRPAHLSQPRSTPSSTEVDDILVQMRDDGHEQIAVWGAGDHTKCCLGALFESPVDITCLVDDATERQGRQILGWRVVSVDELMFRSEVTAVLISSRHPRHIERMWSQRERFAAAGKTLYRLPDSQAPGVSDLALPPVLAVTLPKSGTWLLMRMLTLAGFDAYRGQNAMYRLARKLASGEAHGYENSTLFELLPAGQATTLHDPSIINTQVMERFVANGRCKVVLLVRDPRDVVVARAHFWKHPDNARHHSLRDLDVRDVMNRVITGSAGFTGISELIAGYRALYQSPHVHTIRFEEIARAAAAPDNAAAIGPVVDLLRHCGIRNRSPERVRSILSRLELKPYPGRVSIVDEWRTEFGVEQTALFDELAADSLKLLGYA